MLVQEVEPQSIGPPIAVSGATAVFERTFGVG